MNGKCLVFLFFCLIFIFSCKQNSFVARKYMPGKFYESPVVAKPRILQEKICSNRLLSAENANFLNSKFENYIKPPKHDNRSILESAKKEEVSLFNSVARSLQYTFHADMTTQPYVQSDNYHNPEYHNNYIVKQVKSAFTLAVVGFIMLFVFFPLAIVIAIIAKKKILVAEAALRNHNRNGEFAREYSQLETARLLTKVTVVTPLVLLALLILLFLVLLLLLA